MPARTCDGRSVLATIVDVARIGLPVMALVIAGESMGLPLPGETALIAAAILASRGKLDIVPVIALAACAAIIGDNLGYLVGRRGGGRPLLAGARRGAARAPPAPPRRADALGRRAVLRAPRAQGRVPRALVHRAADRLRVAG